MIQASIQRHQCFGLPYQATTTNTHYCDKLQDKVGWLKKAAVALVKTWLEMHTTYKTLLSEVIDAPAYTCS